MAGILTDEGAKYLLGAAFGATSKITSFTVQLLSVANTLSDADTPSTHTVAAGGGYADQTTSNNATIGTIAGGIPVAAFSQVTWTFTGPLTTNPNVVGYQVVADSKLLFIEKFDVAVTPQANDVLSVTPRVMLGNGTPT